MAKKKAKKTKVEKKPDGPVAKARAIFEKMKTSTDSSAIIAACVAAGVVKGTATTQLGKWRKENGITVKRGGARKKTKATDKPKSAASAKAKGKKVKASEKVPGKGKNGPVTITRIKPGSRRHKPPASQPAASKTENADTASQASAGVQTAPTPAAAASSPAAGVAASTTIPPAPPAEKLP